VKILIVDDEPAVVSSVAANLEAAGYSVATAASGEEALAISADALAKIPLAVIDVAMWPINGTQLAELLRAKNPTVCVLFISGGTGISMLSTEHFAERSWGFLEKPFRPRQLLEAVERLLAMRRLAHSA
jgi:two-component system, NtrC family, response regulator GlrR